MNHDFIIRTTNRIALYATIILVYWVFVFLTITVFDLKIFREQMTEMYLLSLLGIFAVLGGAIILNLMSNLSSISVAVTPQRQSGTTSHPINGKMLIIAMISFPLIASLLFAGDYFSAQRKKALLIAAAERIVTENRSTLATLANYQFSPDYVKATEYSLNILSKIDKNLPKIRLIQPETIDGKALFLSFGARGYTRDEKEKIEKTAYIYPTTQDEREYLKRFFSGNEKSLLFHAEKGNYQLYFPTTVDGKKMLLYFSDYQRYGKFGS